MASLVRALYLGSLVMSCLLLKTVPVVAADSPSVELPGQEQVVGDSVAEGLTAGTRETAPEDSVAIDVLEGLRSRQLAVVAEGTGDGRMILSLTNRTQKNSVWFFLRGWSRPGSPVNSVVWGAAVAAGVVAVAEAAAGWAWVWVWGAAWAVVAWAWAVVAWEEWVGAVG